jgi:hypothetical protein
MLHLLTTAIFLGVGYLSLGITRQAILERQLEIVRAFRRGAQQ